MSLLRVLLVVSMVLFSIQSFPQSSVSRNEPITNLVQAKRIFNQFFQDQNVSIDDYGNVYLGGGTGGDGHCYFRLTDVDFDLEERPQEPGCADICDERVFFHIKCRRSACIRDPWMENNFYESKNSVEELIELHPECSTMMFYGDVKAGRAAFEALKRVKEFFHREACNAR
ncbi:MAG: hypothetical protein ACK4EX_01095 [Thermaurantimonas sp.]|uniref:hypothetical protein n=1 Tax=Thermaurantimonas sp. TaxID=2681568 RepID=UPI00391CC050